nr:xylulose kinase-1 [Tanacetum cinerariifolium]
MDFLNAHTIKYALVVNPTIYVSCIKQFWETATIKKVNDIIQIRALIDGKKVIVSESIIRRDLYLDDADRVECLPNEEIFQELSRMGYEKPPPKLTFYNAMVRNVDSPSKFLMYLRFLQVVMDNQVDDMTTHNTRYTSPALTQKVFANMRRVRKEVEIPIASTPPALQDPTPHATPPQDQPSTPHATPPQDQTVTPHASPTTSHESSIPLLTTLIETYATLSQKVAELEKDKHSQALEILQLKKRVQKLENKKKSKSSWLKRLRRVEQVQERHLDSIRKYQNLKKKPVSIAQARKNMIIYLKNMAGYKMEYFKGMTYDKNMLEIVPVRAFKVEALHVKYPIIDWEIHTEGSRVYWKIIRVRGITEAYAKRI